jgi:hypothetical protein
MEKNSPANLMLFISVAKHKDMRNGCGWGPPLLEMGLPWNLNNQTPPDLWANVDFAYINNKSQFGNYT